MRRLLASIVALLGLASVGLGIMGQTVWAPATSHTATVEVDDPGVALIIDPGVLYIGGTEGTATVSGAPEGTTIRRIEAADDDLTAWLGKVPYTRVTGASSWQALSTQTVNEGSDETLPDPTTADVLRTVSDESDPVTIPVAQQYASDSSTGLSYDALVFVTDGTQSAPTTVSVTWPNHETNAWVPYAYGAGAVLLIIGILVFVAPSRRSPAAVGAHSAHGRTAARPTIATGTHGRTSGSRLSADEQDAQETSRISPIADEGPREDGAHDKGDDAQ